MVSGGPLLRRGVHYKSVVTQQGLGHGELLQKLCGLLLILHFEPIVSVGELHQLADALGCKLQLQRLRDPSRKEWERQG